MRHFQARPMKQAIKKPQIHRRRVLVSFGPAQETFQQSGIGGHVRLLRSQMSQETSRLTRSRSPAPLVVALDSRRSAAAPRGTGWVETKEGAAQVKSRRAQEQVQGKQ